MAPKKIVISRHAEKPTDPGDIDLAPAGQQRAQELVNFLPGVVGQVPDNIFATDESKHSNRPFETGEPYAQSIGVTIQQTFTDDETPQLGTDLITKKAYDDTVDVIFCHHGEIPALIAALSGTDEPPANSFPADPSDPSKWNASVFNVLIVLEWTDGSAAPTITQVTEPF